MPLYEYRCAAGHVTEAIRPVSVSAQRCSCGLWAARESVYRIAAVEREIRYAGRDFIEATGEIEESRVAMERREGVSVPPPDFYSAAMAEVARLRQQGATSSKDLR